MIARTVVAVAGLFLGGSYAAAGQCEGPRVDPWVTDFRDRVMSYDALGLFALKRYGAPTACEGAVTDEFDGEKFGRLALTFGEGITLEVETLPPETSVTTLRAAAGFDDEASVRKALEDDATSLGLAIDWTAPEVSEEGDEVTRAFWDPDTGLNASAALVYRGDRLVAVRVSMAL